LLPSRPSNLCGDVWHFVQEVTSFTAEAEFTFYMHDTVFPADGDKIPGFALFNLPTVRVRNWGWL